MNLPPLVTATLCAQFVVATKPLVDALLAMNTKNRKLMPSAVARLKNDIQNGSYLPTCEGFGVDSNGVLADGQHRLEALKDAGYPPVLILLVTGLDPRAQAVINRGSKRSLADALTLMQGRTFSNAVVAACTVFVNIKNADKKSADFVHADTSARSDGIIKQSVFRWEEDVAAVIEVCGGQFRAAVIAALAVYYRHNPEAALSFAGKLRTGINLAANDPALRLRETLSKSTASLTGAVGSLRAFKLCVTACIADANHRELKIIKESHSWSEAPWRPWLAD